MRALGEGGGWGRLEATSLGRWRGQGGRGMGGLSFAHFPDFTVSQVVMVKLKLLNIKKLCTSYCTAIAL